MQQSVLKAKAGWQCRGGMKELDMILGEFLNREFDALSLEEQQDFLRFLQNADTDLYQWLLEAELAPEDCIRWVKKIAALKAGV